MRKTEAQTAIAVAVQDMDSLWSRARFYGLSAAEVESELAVIIRRMDRNGRAPCHAVAHVRGYWQALWFTGRAGGNPAEEVVAEASDGTRYGRGRMASLLSDRRGVLAVAIKHLDAAEELHRLGLSHQPDFFTLPQAVCGDLLNLAATVAYRTPANATGSRVRYFYAALCRAADRAARHRAGRAAARARKSLPGST